MAFSMAGHADLVALYPFWDFRRQIAKNTGDYGVGHLEQSELLV